MAGEPTSAASPKTSESPNPTVRVEGLAGTLGNIDHELKLLSHATKYKWINQRLILLRNALVALSVLVVVVVTAVACYREAYRQPSPSPPLISRKEKLLGSENYRGQVISFGKSCIAKNNSP